MKYSINFINLNLSDSVVASKFYGVYDCFFRALRNINCEVTYSDSAPKIDADIIVVPMGSYLDYISIQAINNFPGPIILYAPPANRWFDKTLLNQIKPKILFTYGTDASLYSQESYDGLNIPYHYFPFASDPSIMKPLNIKREYDFIFIGSYNHAPRRLFFLNLLLKSIGERSILCIGRGWEKFGFFEQLISWGPLLNTIYNMAKVCLNIHSEEQVRGIETQLDLNNRIFDLAMAGCCQVSDNPNGGMLCFNENEIVFARDPEEWVERAIYYSDHEEEAELYRKNSRIRALKEHTWKQRAETFFEFIDEYYSKWEPITKIKVNPNLKIVLNLVKHWVRKKSVHR